MPHDKNSKQHKKPFIVYNFSNELQKYPGMASEYTIARLRKKLLRRQETSLNGCPRYYQEFYEDSMTIVEHYSMPANAKWDEIIENIEETIQKASFSLKLQKAFEKMIKGLKRIEVVRDNKTE